MDFLRKKLLGIWVKNAKIAKPFSADTFFP